jgi:putative ABC transport system permease protein
MDASRHRLPGTSMLAWRNLAHDRARLVGTLVGIVFAVVLMGAQMGLLVGFAQTASTMIEHTDADLWISAVGTTNVDITAGLPLRWRHVALEVPGVASAAPYMVQFAFWKKPTGGNESVIMVGTDLASARGGPWSLTSGDVDDLARDGAVILDRLYLAKLGVHEIGDTVEINGKRARLVGITSGIRTFTQSPYVFSTHAAAQRYPFFRDDQTTYVLVKLARGADPETVRAAIQARIGDRATVWTRTAFARQTQRYWLITTGAGAALLLAASLGLVVGIVIVGQTQYATTIDRLPE